MDLSFDNLILLAFLTPMIAVLWVLAVAFIIMVVKTVRSS